MGVQVLLHRVCQAVGLRTITQLLMSFVDLESVAYCNVPHLQRKMCCCFFVCLFVVVLFSITTEIICMKLFSCCRQGQTKRQRLVGLMVQINLNLAKPGFTF